MTAELKGAVRKTQEYLEQNFKLIKTTEELNSYLEGVINTNKLNISIEEFSKYIMDYTTELNLYRKTAKRGIFSVRDKAFTFMFDTNTFTK